MISKVFSGHSFGPACSYICQKPGSKILAAEGVRGHNHHAMAEDFILQQERRPRKKQACFHGILSFYPGEGEKLGDYKLLEIARTYLDEIGIKNTQYAIAKHTDRAHIHLHIIVNLVDNSGKVISDSYIGLRAKKVAQQLTEEYHLVPAKKKNLVLTHPGTFTQNVADRYKIYEAILKTLPHCRNLSDLEKQLKKQEISTVYKLKGQTNEKQGISFQIGQHRFKGSKIDRKFSLGNLEKYFSFHQQLSNKAVTTCQSSAFLSNPASAKAGPNTAKTIVEEITNLITEMEQPEFGLTYIDGEVGHEPRKKKRKKRGYPL